MISNYSPFFNKYIKYNLITRYSIKNFYQIMFFKKIILHFSFKNYILLNKKKILISLLLLNYFNNQKPLLLKSKKNILILKIKKNMIVGCKITLRKQNLYNFFAIFITDILPSLEHKIKLNNSQKNIDIRFDNFLKIKKFKNKFLIFQNLTKLDISIKLYDNNLNKLLSVYLNELKF